MQENGEIEPGCVGPAASAARPGQDGQSRMLAGHLSASRRVEYKMVDELNEGFFKNCPSTFGALKSIAFTRSAGGDVKLDGALQVGFQERLLGAQNVISAESGLKAIPITPVTKIEIAKIHQMCADFGACQ